jgi:hypothetical protein
MSETTNKFQQAELADLLGLIERLAGELSLAEEPARFIAALEQQTEPPGAGT